MKKAGEAWDRLGGVQSISKSDAVRSTALLIARKGRVQYASLPAARFAGLSVDDFIGRDLRDVLQAEEGDLDFRYLRPEDGQQHFYARLRSGQGEAHRLLVELTWMAGEEEPLALLTLIPLEEVLSGPGQGQDPFHTPEGSLSHIDELNAIIQSMAEAVIICDARGTPVLVNPVSRDLLGVDLTGELPAWVEGTVFRSQDGKQLSWNELPHVRALRGERVTGMRLRYHRSDGQEVTIETSASPLYVGKEISGAVVVCRDVTEREELLDQLEAERARLSTVITHAPEAILVADDQARIILANRAAEQLYGQAIPIGEPYESHARMKFIRLDGTPYDPRQLPLTRSALDGEVIVNEEVLLQLEDGTRRELLINSAPIYDRSGHLTGAIAISQDIGGRKRIEEQMRRNAARSEVLAALSQAFAEAGLYYAAVLSTITHQITDKIGDASLIRLTSDDSKWLDVVAVHHPDGESLARLRKVLRMRRLRVEEGLSGKVLQNRRPILISDPEKHPDQLLLEQEFGDWLRQEKTASLLCIPLQAQGSLIGTLTVIRPAGEEPYTSDDQIFFMSLADRAALAIENAMLYADEARRARELDALHSATAVLLSTLDLNTLLSQILDAAQSAIPAAEKGTLHLVGSQSGQLEIRATLNYEDPRIAQISHPNGSDYPSVVVRNRKPLLVHDALSGAFNGPGTDERPEEETFRSLIIAPLFMNDEVIGTLSLTAARPFAFTKEDLRLLTSFATTTSAAIQNALLHARVQTLAITDPLTEQYNRRGFFDLAQREIERFSRYQYPLTAMMVDIDHFKEVNDTFGHRAGDRVLRALADRIDQNIRQVDILGRYGGEEFAILLPETDLDQACEIAERIRAAVAAEPIVESEQGPIWVSISVGVTQAASPNITLAELLEKADQALYQAKQNGRNRVEIL